MLAHLFIENVDIFQNFDKFEAIQQIVRDSDAITQFTHKDNRFRVIRQRDRFVEETFSPEKQDELNGEQ